MYVGFMGHMREGGMDVGEKENTAGVTKTLYRQWKYLHSTVNCVLNCLIALRGYLGLNGSLISIQRHLS